MTHARCHGAPVSAVPPVDADDPVTGARARDMVAYRNGWGAWVHQCRRRDDARGGADRPAAGPSCRWRARTAPRPRAAPERTPPRPA